MEIKNLDLQNQIDELRDMIYPVGSIYFSTNSANPSTIWGGTWTQIKGKFLIGVDSSDETGHWDSSKLSGGRSEVKLTTNELPSHTHIQNPHSHVGLRWGKEDINDAISLNGGGWKGYNLSYNANLDGNTVNSIVTTSTTATNQYIGKGQSFSIMPPFYSVYIWERTA